MNAPSTEPAPGLTLFTDKITARENERRMRVAQARRDRRDAFAAGIGHGQRSTWPARAATGAGMLVAIVAAAWGFAR